VVKDVTVCSQTYTADPMMDWVDVREWVLDTYPWHESMSLNKLKTLNPEDVGWNHGEPSRAAGWGRGFVVGDFLVEGRIDQPCTQKLIYKLISLEF